jgi:hypothetical protein
VWAGHEFAILLPPPEGWNYGHVLPHLVLCKYLLTTFPIADTGLNNRNSCFHGVYNQV